MSAGAACGMGPPAADEGNTSAGAGSSMPVSPPPLRAVVQSGRGGRSRHGRKMRDSAPRALRKAELHALPQRFRRILQDLTQTLRFGMQCCAYKFNPPVAAAGRFSRLPREAAVEIAGTFGYSFFLPRLRRHIRAFSSGGERFPDTEEVRSSNLLTPTRNSQTRGYALWSAFISAVQALRTWHEPLHVLNRPGPLGRHTYPRHISACTRPYAWMLQPSTFVGKSCFGMTRVACRRKSVGSSASLPAG